MNKSYILHNINENLFQNDKSRCDTYKLHIDTRKLNRSSRFDYPINTSLNETSKELSPITSKSKLKTTKRRFGNSMNSAFGFTKINYNKAYNTAHKPEILITNNVDQLQSTLENVKMENQKLKQLSTEIIMNKDMRSTIHSFYQNVVLPDNKTNIMILEEKIRNYKTEVAKLTADCNKLKKENNRLNKIIAYYKELEVSRFKIKTSGKMIIKTKLPSKLEKNELETQQQRDYIDSILSSLRRIAKANTMRVLIDVLYKELEVLFKRCKCGIFIVNPKLQKLYQKENGKAKPITLESFIVSLAINGKEQNTIRPIFTTLGMIKDITRTNEAITIPIIKQNSALEKDVYLVIQLEGFKLKLIHDSELLVLYLNNYR